MKRIIPTLIFLLFNYFSWAQLAPNFTITDTEGNTIRLYEDMLDSNKIVVIKMFFVACPLCKPYNVPFQSLYEELGAGEDDVEFLLLTTKSWDSNTDVAGYRVEYGLTFPGAGDDGGGYLATEPYRNGTFGTFFGAPEFIIIEPDRTVHFDVTGGGVETTMNTIRSRIAEIKDGGSGEVTTTNVSIDISDYKGGNLPSHTLYLRSADDISNRYEVPSTFTYPSEDYPVLENPEVFIEITETSNIGVSTFDLVWIQRHILTILQMDNFQIQAADVNGSQTITAADLLSMRKVILNIQDGFQVNRSYISLDSGCGEDTSRCKESVKIDTDLEEQAINFTVVKYGDVK